MRQLIVAMFAAAGLVSVAVAQASQPIITPAPAVDFVDTTCGFAVSVHFTVAGETAKIFSDGDVIVTGPLTAELSANGATVSLNIAGPGFVYPSDGSVT